MFWSHGKAHCHERALYFMTLFFLLLARFSNIGGFNIFIHSTTNNLASKYDIFGVFFGG